MCTYHFEAYTHDHEGLLSGWFHIGDNITNNKVQCATTTIETQSQRWRC